MNPVAAANDDRGLGWMRNVLLAAAVYNILWGASVIAAPHWLFEWVQIDPPRYPQVWQCVGMIVGVYGVGYWIAARAPLRHWPIVLVGLLGKVLGPMGFVGAATRGDLPWAFGATIVTNDLIWWIPFGLILFEAMRYHSLTANDPSARYDWDSALQSAHSHRGQSLAELSALRPVLVVFLRHAGCTFCRETLADLATKRRYIESQGITLALVHMSPPLQATQLLQKYDLDDVHRFSDQHCQLYEAFGLPRGRFSQLFGWKVWWRGFLAAVLDGHGIGTLDGDGFRLAGAFLLRNGRIIAARRTQSAADRLNLLDIASIARTNAANSGGARVATPAIS
jgi:peroxiredoxin